jgi:hypothetical protein
MIDTTQAPQPWYREPWPWILMAGPVAAILGGGVTAWLAISTADGLVAEDYYRQGLAVNRTLAREARAKQLGISARVEFSPGAVRIFLEGQDPEALFVDLAHATRAGHDLRLRLARAAPGTYVVELPPLPPGRWRVTLEPPRGDWRIAMEAP